MSASPSFGDFLRFCHVGPVSERRWFTKEEDARLRREYPNTPTVELAAAMGRSKYSINVRASKLGVRKSGRLRRLASYLASQKPRRQNRGVEAAPPPPTRRAVAEARRRELLAALEAEAARPLSAGVTLSDAERQAIRDRVRSGKKAQSVLCNGNGSALGLPTTSQWRRR